MTELVIFEEIKRSKKMLQTLQCSVCSRCYIRYIVGYVASASHLTSIILIVKRKLFEGVSTWAHPWHKSDLDELEYLFYKYILIKIPSQKFSGNRGKQDVVLVPIQLGLKYRIEVLRNQGQSISKVNSGTFKRGRQLQNVSEIMNYGFG